jgi:hypothetical protein
MFLASRQLIQLKADEGFPVRRHRGQPRNNPPRVCNSTRGEPLMSVADNNLQSQPADKPRVHWGAAAIGKRINRPERATYHLLENGHVSGAKKIAGRWSLSERAAQELFGE